MPIYIVAAMSSRIFLIPLHTVRNDDKLGLYFLIFASGPAVFAYDTIRGVFRCRRRSGTPVVIDRLSQIESL